MIHNAFQHALPIGGGMRHVGKKVVQGALYKI